MSGCYQENSPQAPPSSEEPYCSHDDASMPLPLIIAHDLTKIVYNFRREGFLETFGPAGTNAMNQLIQAWLTNFLRWRGLQIPPFQLPCIDGIHLKQVVTLYLFALPFTLVKELGWYTIPIVTVVAFNFMGIEGIADEIEMLFGHDQSDLPLDRYWLDLKEEISYIIHRLPEGGEGLHGYDDGEGDD